MTETKALAMTRLDGNISIWHGFPVITHIEVKNGCRSAILNLIKLNFFMVYPHLKLHIWVKSNGRAIWFGLHILRMLKK